nr:immunoglobulin heavy chain junction region [Mus musculus]
CARSPLYYYDSSYQTMDYW